MPAGMMIPARNAPSMIGRNGNVGVFGSPASLVLGQVSVEFPVFFNQMCLILCLVGNVLITLIRS